jgi:hypothetical protein
MDRMSVISRLPIQQHFANTSATRSGCVPATEPRTGNENEAEEEIVNPASTSTGFIGAVSNACEHEPAAHIAGSGSVVSLKMATYYTSPLKY